MNISKITILLLMAVLFVQANPNHRRHHTRPYYRGHYTPAYHSRYTPYYSSYRSYRYYTPVIVTSKTTTTYPSNLVLITAEDAAEDIIALNTIMNKGLITEKEFSRAKGTLLNRIGMSVNPDAGDISTTEVISQIETLYELQSTELLSHKEYAKQKRKLLAMI